MRQLKRKSVLTLWILCIALAIVSGSCAPSSSPTDDDYNIPYDSIQVNGFSENPQLGWSKETVQEYENRYFISSGVYVFRRHGFSLSLTDGLVSIIAVTDKGPHCYGGITIGSTEADVIAKWGEAAEVSDLHLVYFTNSSGDLCDKASAVSYVVFYMEDGIVYQASISNVM